MVNDPPAFSNPRAWIHFHATFDFFHWIMSGGSCDSRSQNRSSSLPSSFPLLYHSERKLVLVALPRVIRLVWSTQARLTTAMAVLSIFRGFTTAVSFWIT